MVDPFERVTSPTDWNCFGTLFIHKLVLRKTAEIQKQSPREGAFAPSFLLSSAKIPIKHL
jgi:hypothetical protein